jgi:biopolymer transport protein ExbD
MNLRRPRKRRAFIFDMTPMIDVVLQLIIFFMYTSQFTRMTRTPLELPAEVGETGEGTGQTSIVVDVTREGGLIVEGQTVDAARLISMVRVEIDKAGGDGSKVDLLIRADRLCPSGHINRLAEELTRHGLRTWKLGTAEVRR